jgi:ribonuclease HI
MADFSEPWERTTHIYAHGAGADDPDRGPGGWGALLVYGEHKREVHGFEAETCAERMQLTAVVHALECLTRPVFVELRVNGEYLRTAVVSKFGGWTAGRVDLTVAVQQDANADLWRRLRSVAEQHAIWWVWTEDDDEGDADYECAAALAGREVEENKPAPDFDGPSIETALKRFLQYRSGQVSARVLRQAEDVLGTFEWSVDWYYGKNTMGATPAGQIADYFGDLFEVLVHKNFASATELRATRAVLTALLRWLQAEGILDATTVAAKIEDIKDRVDSYVDIRKFVDALSAHVDRITGNAWDDLDEGEEGDDDDHDHDGEVDGEEGDDDEGRDSVADEYLRITDVGVDTITFGDEFPDIEVGPVRVPAGIAKMAETGWRILLSAHRVNGEWHLTDVVNGEPM